MIDIVVGAKLVPQERVQQRFDEQFVDVLLPMIMESIVDEVRLFPQTQISEDSEQVVDVRSTIEVPEISAPLLVLQKTLSAQFDTPDVPVRVVALHNSECFFARFVEQYGDVPMPLHVLRQAVAQTSKQLSGARSFSETSQGC